MFVMAFYIFEYRVSGIIKYRWAGVSLESNHVECKTNTFNRKTVADSDDVGPNTVGTVAMECLLEGTDS